LSIRNPEEFIQGEKVWNCSIFELVIVSAQQTL